MLAEICRENSCTDCSLELKDMEGVEDNYIFCNPDFLVLLPKKVLGVTLYWLTGNDEKSMFIT